MISKSTYEVLNCPWEKKIDQAVFKIPPKWNCNNEISIDDVTYWEQIYHQPGSIGIYVAWSPYAEFYLIVYDLFANTPAGIKTFSGPDAIRQVTQLAEDLNINLSLNRIQV